eukprot:Hpha_TRINITY_DN15232_c3_g1::TRINITY_DN15232_c3_g1_i1::g.66585::m.66585
MNVQDEVAALRAVYGEEACVCDESGSAAVVRIEVAPKVFVQVTLPVGYPDAAGAVQARMIPSLKQEGTQMLNEYVAQEVVCGDGAAVLYELVYWVQEVLLPALPSAGAAAPAAEVSDAPPAEDAVLHRQWLWFIGFYTRSIRKEFCETAASMGCTGFLMPGKPAVAAVEGTPAVIAEFLRVTRTVVFAAVAPSARKMQLSLLDAPIAGRAFAGFEEVDLTADPATHKRKDMTDLGSLEAFLSAHGVGHAFQHLFNMAVPGRDA